MIGREQPDQMLRGIRFTLDFDRLMGVRSAETYPIELCDRSGIFV